MNSTSKMAHMKRKKIFSYDSPFEWAFRDESECMFRENPPQQPLKVYAKLSARLMGGFSLNIHSGMDENACLEKIPLSRALPKF